MNPSERDLRQAILELCRQRGLGKTICPSEAARKIDPERWRDLMEAVRQAAFRLSDEGILEITQKGMPVESARVKGTIRLREKPR